MKPSAGRRSGGERPPDVTLGRLSHAARQAADGGVPARLSPLGWERLQRARARRERAARLWTAGVAVAVAVFAGGVVSGKLWLGRARDISYVVEGADLGEGGYIHEIGAGGARLRFSEGTRIELDAGARASVVSSGPRGARLRLESGRAHFEVVHRPRGSWSVDAGPFSIAVTGTIFDVKWAGADELLEVSLLRGAVTVRGPLAGEGVTLRPGQRLISHLRERQFHIEELAPPREPAAAGAGAGEGRPATTAAATIAESPAAPAAEPQPPAASAEAQAAAYRRLVSHLLVRPPHVDAPAPRAKRGGAMVTGSNDRAPSRIAPPVAVAVAGEDPADVRAKAAPGVSRSPVAIASPAPAALPPAAEPPPAAETAAPAATLAPAGWPGRVAKGDFRGVLRDAQQYGIDACVTGCDRAALAALADAARYGGDATLARRALLAERQRFAGSPPAQAAAFLLGRMAEEDGQTPREALEWYEHYLDEAPDGAYAAEALGRKMLVVNRMGDRAAAGRLAAEYLRRFPNGSYISQATTLLKPP